MAVLTPKSGIEKNLNLKSANVKKIYKLLIIFPSLPQ